MMYVMTIRDIVANAHHNPFFVASIGGCKRSFADEVNKTDNNPIAAHPDDHELLELGTWDEITATFKLHPQPIQHGVGSSFKITR